MELAVFKNDEKLRKGRAQRSVGEMGFGQFLTPDYEILSENPPLTAMPRANGPMPSAGGRSLMGGNKYE